MAEKKKSLTKKDICIPKLTAALLTTAKIWEQPTCPLTDE